MAKNNYSLITTSQLARICRVSQGTVDRALNNRPGINQKTKQHILDAAKKYGYSPNLSTTTVSGSKSMLYGIVLFDLNNDYFSRFIMDFEILCKKIGYNSIVMFTHNDLQTEIGCINQLVHLGVDGIVLCSVGKGEEYSAFLKSLNVPVVTIGNRIEDIPFVGINDYCAMRDITRYAVDKGYREFIYYAPVLRKRDTENIYAQEERYRAFIDEVERRNMKHYLAVNQEELLSAIKQSSRCAVLCPSDYYAIRVLNIIRDVRLVGLGVTGFDNCDILKKGNINIDSLAYNRSTLAETIYARLKGDITDETSYIEHRIVARGSM